MTKAQFGTPEYFREILAQIEEELAEDLDGESGKYSYAYAYGRLLTSHKFAIAQLEQALENARPHCRPGCKYIQGHSGPCIERDLDAEIDAGRWGIDYVTDPSKWGCANAIDPNKWGEPPFYHVTGDDPEFVNVVASAPLRSATPKHEPDEDFVNVNHE